jgi:surface protein
MKKLILFITVLTTIGCQSDIYKDENGIIKIKEDIQIGFIGEVDGVSYKVVDSTMLYTMVDNNEDLRFICTSKITNTSELFIDSMVNGDISNWDVSKVTNMSGMFMYSQLNGDISNWDVSKVTDMGDMFYDSKIPIEYRPKFK